MLGVLRSAPATSTTDPWQKVAVPGDSDVTATEQENTTASMLTSGVRNGVIYTPTGCTPKTSNPACTVEPP